MSATNGCTIAAPPTAAPISAPLPRLSWLIKAPAAAPPSSGLSRLDSTRPYAGARPPQAAPGQPANRKHERMARRELLYTVVREAMVRAGVLSSSYKFKVLSLDPRGRQFMVMVDLAQGAGSDTNRLAEIEKAVAQSAKARYDIMVSAVYRARGLSRAAIRSRAVRHRSATRSPKLSTSLSARLRRRTTRRW